MEEFRKIQVVKPYSKVLKQIDDYNEEDSPADINVFSSYSPD